MNIFIYFMGALKGQSLGRERSCEHKDGNLWRREWCEPKDYLSEQSLEGGGVNV